MNKLKELAYKQLQSGSDQINYAEIVTYLKNSEGFFADEIISKEERGKIYAGETVVDIAKTDSVENIASEPAVVGLGTNQAEQERRWGQCMHFLRNNPKLLLQMIPNPSDDEEELAKAISVGRL